MKKTHSTTASDAEAGHPEPLVIGRYYPVPCVHAPIWRAMVPLFGPLHEDREHIGFEDEHWHLDWRFVSESFLAKRTGKGTRHPHAAVISLRNTSGPVVVRRLKCKRVMPEFPRWKAPWMERLDAAYEGQRLKCGMVCPHRGLPLSGCPVKDGVVVCPGHGLAWNVETGALVSDYQKKP